MQDFYRQHGFVPYFESRPATVQWCYDFWREHVRPNKLVVVHLRNNPLEDAVRNAPLEHWLELIRQAAGTYDATFVLIGAREEIDPRFRELPNVLVAGDFGSSMEQDFVLVQSAQLFLGTPSRPNTMAWYSDTAT
ncbi:MAG: hypothetical protein M5U09_30570 [Gammaproteobacteria bacterium]|nr:hypothetical protein [Gammaproteobacteria bacterium]